MKQQSENNKIAYRVSGVSIGVNTALSVGKLLAGFLANSSAMISDGIHSASDVLSTVGVILGIKFSSKKEDKDHEYGHERLESIASILLAMLLLATGLAIGYDGFNKLTHLSTITIPEPGMLALVAAAISIIVKEWMYWYTRRAAKKINSNALMADAWHHRSDSLSSIGAFVGILGARMGYLFLDPVASVVICLFIGKAAYDIFKEATDKLVDKSAGEIEESEIRKTVESVPGVMAIETLRTRQFGPRVLVDLEVYADNNISFREAHQISENVEAAVCETYPEVKEVMVHISPYPVTALVPVN